MLLAAAGNNDKSGGAAEGSGFYGIVQYEGGLRSCLLVQHTHKHLGHKTSFLRVENMWIFGAKMDKLLADHRFVDSQIRNTHTWKSGTLSCVAICILHHNMHFARETCRPEAAFIKSAYHTWTGWSVTHTISFMMDVPYLKPSSTPQKSFQNKASEDVPQPRH